MTYFLAGKHRSQLTSVIGMISSWVPLMAATKSSSARVLDVTTRSFQRLPKIEIDAKISAKEILV